MFKRLFWMSTGVAVGASGAFWAKRKVEATVEQLLPEQVAERAVVSARGLGATVKAAAAEGRAAMKSTEAELRARVEERTFVGDAPTPAKARTSRQQRTPPRKARRSSAPTPTGSRRRSRR